MYFYHTFFTSKGGLVLLTEYYGNEWPNMDSGACRDMCSQLLALNSSGDDDMNAGLLHVWYRWRAISKACYMYMLRYKKETALQKEKTSGAHINNY